VEGHRNHGVAPKVVYAADQQFALDHTSNTTRESTVRLIAFILIFAATVAARGNAAEQRDEFVICQFPNNTSKPCHGLTESSMKTYELTAYEIAIVGLLRSFVSSRRLDVLTTLANSFAPPQPLGSVIDGIDKSEMWFPQRDAIDGSSPNCFPCGVVLAYRNGHLAEASYSVIGKFLVTWKR
jgi:hypothetical protein